MARGIKRRDRKVPNTIGKNITLLRWHWGLTQDEVAATVSRDRHWLGRIERGEQELEAQYLPAIARLLRCHPEELVEMDLRGNE